MDPKNPIKRKTRGKGEENHKGGEKSFDRRDDDEVVLRERKIPR